MASRQSRRFVMARYTSTSEHSYRFQLLKPSLWIGGSIAAALFSIRAATWTAATMRSWTAATVTAMFMSAIVGAQTPGGGATRSGVNPEITALADAYTRAFLAGDARAVAEMFTTDG